MTESQGSRNQREPGATDKTTHNNSEKLDKYFYKKDYVWYQDDVDRRCVGFCCHDIKKRVTRDNANLGITIGFG